MKRIMQLGLLLLASLLLITACQSTPSPQPNPTPQPANVASVSVAESSALLENIGATQQLSAKLLDDQGSPVTTTVTWESNKPDIVKVNSDGTVEGVAIGSAQIRAKVGDKTSAPVVVAVGALADEVARIETAKIVSEPVFAEGSSPFDVGSQYTVVLKDVSPSAGKLWFSKTASGLPVMGKVLSSETVADGIKVTLEIVPISTIFKDLNVEETLDLSEQALEIPETLDALYDIEKQANGDYVFTPKSTSELSALVDVGPFSCSGSLPSAAFTLGTPGFTLRTGTPTVQFTNSVTTVIIPPSVTTRARLLFTANPSITITNLSGTLRADFANKSASCKLRNGINLGFSFLGFGYTSKMFPGVTLGGSYGAGTRSFNARLQASSNIRIGFSCRATIGTGASANCENLSTGNAGTVRGQVTMTSLGNLGQSIRDLKAGVFLGHLFSVDNPLFSQTLYEGSEGLEMSFDLASLQTQITDANPADYNARLYVTVDPFAAVRSFVRFLLGDDAADDLSNTDINIDVATVQSPLISSATLNTFGSLRNVSVTLNANRVNFFGGASPFGLLYNVQKVQLIEVDANNVPVRTVSEVTATDGQTNFTLSIPTLRIPVDTSRLHVTIVPVILPDIPVGTRAVR
jgi:hypothetical protein